MFCFHVFSMEQIEIETIVLAELTIHTLASLLYEPWQAYLPKNLY